MDKIKKSAGIKCAAGILLAVSIAAMLVSGLITIVFLEEDFYSAGGKERFKGDIIQNIAYDYSDEISEYYEYKLRTDAGIDTMNYHYDESFKEKFSEENCNMAFVAEVIDSQTGERKKEYETLSNYECMDYKIKDSVSHIFTINYAENKFSFDITPEEIYDAMGMTYRHYGESGEVIEDYYYDDQLYLEESNGKHYIANGIMRYCLEDNPEFVEKYEKFLENLNKDYTEFSEYGYYYDEENGRVEMTIETSKSVQAVITYFVKSEFTARDNFYDSIILKHIDFVFDASVPVLIISAIVFIVCLAYLTMSAGHRKGIDGISLNGFDKVPYDIVLAVLIAAVVLAYCAFSAYAIDYYMERSLLIAAVVPICGICLLLLSAVYYTTVARLKAGCLLRNTVLWRIFAWLWRGIKNVWKKASEIVKYLWRNINIYWKYLGLFCAAAIVELFFVAAYSYSGAGVFMCFVVNAAIAFFMVIALINMNTLKKGGSEIAGGNTDYEIDTEHMLWEFKKHGENLNSINDGIQAVVEERMKSERMKTELITNVSHDIKTPLTSIISYVDLLSKENIENENAKGYIDVLERQSARLKKLIEDLIDASKASTGNMPVNLAEMDVRVLLEQALGEFSEKLDKRGLKPVVSYHTENTIAVADGKLLWRTFDNLINNIVKYAQDNTRVYIDLENETIGAHDNTGYIKRTSMIKVTFKNISKEELNMSGDELIERFVRGDSSRNTEGSGLGLSIAKSLMDIQNGKMEIIVDGDLFKVVLLLMRA